MKEEIKVKEEKFKEQDDEMKALKATQKEIAKNLHEYREHRE